MRVLKEELDGNPIDSHYKALECGLSPIDNTSDDFQVRHFVNVVAKYINQHRVYKS